jgi:uncharacterized damage-inducible protein DinB
MAPVLHCRLWRLLAGTGFITCRRRSNVEITLWRGERMTYYGAKQLRAAFQTVRKNTIAIAEDIPSEKYDFKAAPDVKSVAELLAHVAVSTEWQMEVHGRHVAFIDRPMFSEHRARAVAAEQALRTKDEILKALRERGDAFAAFLGGLSEETLQEKVSFPPPLQPESRARFEMLLGTKEHEMHHRGQLMLIERMLGIVPHLTRQREAARA